MGLIVFLLFGFIVGLIARALLPGRQHLGLLMTTILGAVGSFLGGLLGNMVSGAPLTQVHPAGLLGSVLGAVILLSLTGFSTRRLSS